MAQDAVAPRTQGSEKGGWLRSAMLTIRRLDLLPKTPSLGPVDYSPRLVAYVTITVVAAIAIAVVAVLNVPMTFYWWAKQTNPNMGAHPGIAIPIDLATLAIAGVTIFLMSVFAIRSSPPANVSWVPTAFVHLGLSVTFGPVGAAVGALAEPIGVSVRSRNGWFRTMFNIANGFLANVAAWAVFRWIYGPGAVPDLAAGLAAGFVHFTVNSGLVVLVIRVSDRSAPMSRVLRARLSVLPYSIGYGFAAFAFVNMNDTAGAVGFMALLAPVILLHGFLIRYTRNVHEGEVERAAHQMERDRLLLQEFEASERERVKLQADLHDGVVQNLTGLQLALHNGAAHLRREPAGVEDREELLELLEQSAAETRVAMKDLRTLMVDLAPPTLRKEGLEAALLEVLREIKRKGTNTQLDLPPNLRLRKDRAELIFIVAQEMLRNVAAHAHAKNVNVELTTEDGSAILSIQDDGKGFTAADTERRRAEGHLGTSTSVDRVEAVGGTLITDSEPGRGTLVVLSLPIE